MSNSQSRTVANGKLHLFALYADFSAANRAKWVTSQIAKRLGRTRDTLVEMWKLDTAMAGPIREMVAQEAARSDVLVIAVSYLDQREPAIIQWLDSLEPWKPNRRVPGLLIGLLGDEEPKARELDWLVSQLVPVARRLEMDFIWHRTGLESMSDSSWLAGAVERHFGGKDSLPLPPPSSASPAVEILTANLAPTTRTSAAALRL
jgi:hypothetical protein